MPLLSQGKSKIQELGCGQSFFSEELWLSASVLFLPVVYMTAALALISRLGLGLWVFPTGLLLWGTAVVALHREEGWQRLAATLLLFLAAFARVASERPEAAFVVVEEILSHVMGGVLLSQVRHNIPPSLLFQLSYGRRMRKVVSEGNVHSRCRN